MGDGGAEGRVGRGRSKGRGAIMRTVLYITFMSKGSPPPRGLGCASSLGIACGLLVPEGRGGAAAAWWRCGAAILFIFLLVFFG